MKNPPENFAAPETSPRTGNPTQAKTSHKKLPPEAALPHGCRCGKRFGGFVACHCTVCHETFTALTNFDRHRAGTLDGKHKAGQCSPPESLGMTCLRPGVWGIPNPANQKGEA